jgi:hypothetical protein
MIEQAAWVMPRYVICKKENETESFWMMLTRVPIAFLYFFAYFLLADGLNTTGAFILYLPVENET